MFVFNLEEESGIFKKLRYFFAMEDSKRVNAPYNGKHWSDFMNLRVDSQIDAVDI